MSICTISPVQLCHPLSQNCKSPDVYPSLIWCNTGGWGVLCVRSSYTSLCHMMTRPPLLIISAWRTSKDVPQPLHLLWRLEEGNTITCAYKSHNSVAANTIPVTVVTCAFSQAPVFLAHRIRWRSVLYRSANSSLSLVLLMASQFFYPSHISSLRNRRWP